MAVKIIRQPKRIALIGAPTSAAAMAAGHERAPSALREAGLVTRLQEAGYEVTDLGDSKTQVFQPDDDHPRARNLVAVLSALYDLRPRVEQAVKSGALPLVIGGDCAIALATLSAVHRYYRNVSLIWVDRDADMNIPATTPSGCIDGMVVSHIVGRGAPELVRFWGEPPLVREPDVVLFGLERLDPPEDAVLARSPIRRYMAADVLRQGAAASANAALERVHVASHEFVLHFDVDVISSEDFRATTYAGVGGLRLDDVREALEVFLRQKNLAAVEVTVYNPALDPDGSGAKLLIELLATAFAKRLEALAAEEPAVAPTDAVLPTGIGRGPEPAASAAAAAANSTVPATASAVEPAAHESAPAASEEPVDSSQAAAPDSSSEPDTPSF